MKSSSSQPQPEKPKPTFPQKKPTLPSKALEKTMDITQQSQQASLSSMKTMNIPSEEFSQGSSSAMETIDVPPEPSNANDIASMKTINLTSKEDKASRASMKTVQIPKEEQTHTPPQFSSRKNPNQTTIVQTQSLGTNSSEPTAGEMIGDFQVVKKLGEGGMGAVYKCFDVALKRYVALKLLRPRFSQDVKFRARFEIEAQAVAQLRHPNIIQVFRAGEDKQRKCLYFAMDFIEGQGLDNLIEKKQKLSVEETLHYLEQSAEALKYSHQKNILHRDIKPANIMITRDNQALLADFGLAKIVGNSENNEELNDANPSASSNNAYLTQQGSVVGTPHYLSPERIDGINDDKRSDVYALGMVLYHCLTGTPPFIRNSVIEILNAHKYEDPPPLEQLLPQCPKEIIHIFKKSTAKLLEDRYPSIDAMLESIRDIKRAKERKREIAEKKQLSQEVATALLSAKMKQSVAPSRSFARNLGPVLAIIGVLALLTFIFYPSKTNNSTSHVQEVMETRAIDTTWVHGKKCRIAGKLVKIDEPENEMVTLTIDIASWNNEEPDERDILFAPAIWKSIQKTNPLSCRLNSYVVFQGKAVVTPNEIPYLEGELNSPINIPMIKRYHLQENLTTQLSEEFPETLDDEYVQINGMILNIQEFDEELLLLITDLNNTVVYVSITPKTLADIEKQKYSPRVGDEVYAIGRLDIEELGEDENDKKIFKYTIFVGEGKSEFFTMSRQKK